MGEAPRQVEIHETSQPGHELSDAAVRPLAIFLGGLAGSLLVVGILVWLLFDVLLVTINNAPGERRGPPISVQESKQPRLQVSPRTDLEMLRQNEDRILSTLGWVDRDRKIARIPIDAAMTQIAVHGLPKWPAAVENPPAGSGTQPAANPPPPAADHVK